MKEIEKIYKAISNLFFSFNDFCNNAIIIKQKCNRNLNGANKYQFK